MVPQLALAVSKVTVALVADVPPDAAAKVTALRAYEPPLISSVSVPASKLVAALPLVFLNNAK
jgi:hypothetical protein